MKVSAVITGDIRNFSRLSDDKREELVKSTTKLLKGMAIKEGHARMYRGDSYQIQIDDVSKALRKSLKLLCWFRMNSDKEKAVAVSTRLSIGIGSIAYAGNTVLDSDGEAFHLSGRNFDSLEKDEIIRLTTGNKEKDALYRVVLMFINLIAGSWTAAQAETIFHLIDKNLSTQTEIARQMKMSQPAVAKSLKASSWKEVEAGINFVNSELTKQFTS